METSITIPSDSNTHMSYAELMSGYNEAIQKAENYRKTIENLQMRNTVMADKIDHLEQYLTDGFESMDEDTVHALIEIFEFDLTRPVDIALTIEAQVTVNLPLGKNADEIDGLDFNVDIDSYEHEVKYVDISDINAE